MLEIMQTNFYLTLSENSNNTLSELDEMIPWEREVYVNLMINHIKEKEEEMKKQHG